MQFMACEGAVHVPPAPSWEIALAILGGEACIGPFTTLNGGKVHLEEVMSRSDPQAIVNCYGHISRLPTLALSHILSPEKGIANYPRRRRFSSVPPET